MSLAVNKLFEKILTMAHSNKFGLMQNIELFCSRRWEHSSYSSYFKFLVEKSPKEEVSPEINFTPIFNLYFYDLCKIWILLFYTLSSIYCNHFREPRQHGQARPGRSSLLDRIADRMVKGPERPILTVLLKKRRTLRSFRIYGGKKDLATHFEHSESCQILVRTGKKYKI